jgi:hypothetical protein
MKKLISLLLFSTLGVALAADVKISQLPLGSGATVGVSDSFPYVAASTNITKRLTLWDLINLPPIVSTYAPKASPTFTGTVTAATITASGTVTAPTFSGALSGNATTATTATAATATAITDDAATNATMYPTWVTTASGNQAQKVSSTKLTFNPSTGALTTTTFSGALSGNATTASALAANPSDCGADTYATTIAANGNLTCATVTNAGLAGSIAASKLVGSDIATVGTITTGTWTGTAVDATHGGTAQTSWTLGDLLYSSATNVLSKLAGNITTTKKYLAQTGNGSVSAAPTWSQPAFSELSGTATSSQVVTATFTAPTVQKFTSGSGTYTLPSSPRAPLYLRLVMVGGGGGGFGSGTGGGAGGATTASTFGSNSAGGASSASTSTGAAGGTSTLSGASGSVVSGGSGGGAAGVVNIQGGSGGNSCLGGGGGGGVAGPGAGLAGAANTGGGGGGAGTGASGGSAGGGGAGGCIDAVITSPSSTYAYVVGSGGSAGSAGTGGSAGGAGGSGVVIVYEYYQ